MSNELFPRKRRVRYSGKNPRKFEEKYKELNPERYAKDVQKVIESGRTPAGMHRPICVNEILETLNPQPGETGLDATLGFGGHAKELLSRITPGGRLFGIDVDPFELPRTETRLRNLGFDANTFIARKLNFAGIIKLLPETSGGFDFILADLGVSSMQIDNPVRGFTFKADGPLDLRLNPEHGQPASALIHSLTENDIEKLLRENSDEPHSKAIAKNIFQRRATINTTAELAATVRQALAHLELEDADQQRQITKSLQRTFQAFRIAVNDELNVLNQFLRILPYALKPHGRVAILSFHSGEDDRVKKAFADGFSSGLYDDICREPIRARAQERYDNPRSKSAQIRWAIRSADALI
ncbi:MAG: 16S rRNA (cytosine(1402)-N(4))-methyltransferase RsmH [Victivallaceae bacterium]|nr:16S rRNA (cytosine(1402)-N(4))-methyltransferase RsmH [Victivallaceae bacterium]